MVSVVLLAIICMAGISIAQVPDLVGNWSGQCDAYEDNVGFFEYSDGSFSINITEQKERIFAGFLLTKDKGGLDIKKTCLELSVRMALISIS